MLREEVVQAGWETGKILRAGGPRKSVSGQGGWKEVWSGWGMGRECPGAGGDSEEVVQAVGRARLSTRLPQKGCAGVGADPVLLDVNGTRLDL